MTASETNDSLLRAALQATCETAAVDFKSGLDVDSKGDWLEVLKDLVAMANSGASAVPLVFTADGQYVNALGQERFAFRQGTVYFRHGAKSEPGTSDDLRAFLERELERVKTSWLSGIRQVVEAPSGAVVTVGLPTQTPQGGAIGRVRLVADADAPGVALMDPNNTHPHRRSEVVSEVNQRLGEGFHVSPHDILGIRRLYKTDSNRSHYYKPKTGSGQYSEAFVQWIVAQSKAAPAFLSGLRERHHQWTLQENARRQKAAPPLPAEWQYRRYQETQ